MKAKLVALALAAGFSASAFAAPVPTLPPGGLYLKFNGFEQAAVADGATTFAGSKEINWGVFTMTTMSKGAVDTAHDTLTQDGAPFYTDNGVGQITGMFYDVQRGVVSATNPAANPFPATGGIMDLYYRDVATWGFTNNGNSNEAVRIDYSHATGYTQGIFLGRLRFASGMDINPANFIVGSLVPSSGGATGLADSYANVDLAAGGLWATTLDTDYFKTQLGDTRDLRFKNSYNYSQSWNNGACAPGAAAGACPSTDGIIGLRLDDPAMAFALPEPGVLSLMGLALVGMGAVRRRKQK